MNTIGAVFSSLLGLIAFGLVGWYRGATPTEAFAPSLVWILIVYVAMMATLLAAIVRRFWRFLTEDDSTVEAFLER